MKAARGILSLTVGVHVLAFTVVSVYFVASQPWARTLDANIGAGMAYLGFYVLAEPWSSLMAQRRLVPSGEASAWVLAASWNLALHGGVLWLTGRRLRRRSGDSTDSRPVPGSSPPYDHPSHVGG